MTTWDPNHCVTCGKKFLGYKERPTNCWKCDRKVAAARKAARMELLAAHARGETIPESLRR